MPFHSFSSAFSRVSHREITNTTTIIMNRMQHLHPRLSFLEWYNLSTLGQILQTVEASYLQTALKLTYNQKTLQVGSLGSESIYIGDAFVKNLVLIDSEAESVVRRTSWVRALPGELPIPTASIETVILPHLLEFESHHQEILAEICRVMKPEGHLIVLGLNPWNLQGVLQHLPLYAPFWRGHVLGCSRIMHWLNNLRFEAEFHAGFNLSTSRYIMQPRTYLEQTQARLSFAYAIKAIKRDYTIIPIEPDWLSTPSLSAGPVFGTTQRISSGAEE
ncbi:MAG: class I SAM-dependent methyltransferase [Methylococcaceae bacterium]